MDDAERDTRPYRLGALLLLLAAIRWALVLAGEDYGWDFEVSHRVWRGERFDVDYFSTVAPFSYWLNALIFRSFGPSLLGTALARYLAWGIGLIAIHRIAGALGGKRKGGELGLLLAAALGLPSLVSHIHLYNILSFTLALWTFALCFAPWAGAPRASVAVAAALTAAAFFTKQNIGFGAAISGVVALALYGRAKSQSWACTVRYLAGYIAGSGMGVLVGACAMTRISVPGELFAALWLDPLEAKSSFFHSLKVGFPRFVFPFPPVGLWARFLQHGFGVAGLFLCFAFFYFLEKRRDRITGVRGARSRRDVCWLGGTALCLAVLTWLAPASLSQWLTSVRHSFPLENLLTQVVAYVPLYHFLYLLGRRSSREQLEKSDRWLLGGVTFFLLLNVVGFGASRVSYLWTVAPFSLCLYWKTLSILSPDYGDKLVRLGALGVVAVYLFVLPVSGMGPLRTLDRPYLRGLWMKDLLASQFEAEDQFYRPLVEGRRTLWLCAGPNSLTDSLPVPSIANLYADQYARRSERHLRQIWSLNPPDLIVDCGFLADPRAEFLKPEILKPWIDQQYRRVAVRGLVGVYRHSDSKQ